MARPSLHVDTALGYVDLRVANMQRALDFYINSMGFKLHEQHAERGTARLGAGRQDILRLTEVPGARRVTGRSGLYHFAVLTPSRLELARSLRRLAETDWPAQGFSDHLVSEAVYLSDPDGNGIEIYRDRPRTEWKMRGGEVVMAVDPLDVEGVLGELEKDPAPTTGLDPATVLGHMHLHVGNLQAAEAFYSDILGFDMMARLAGSASFVSAGGYHHHVGMNIWAGAGAPPTPPDAVGLRHFVIRLADPADRNAFANGQAPQASRSKRPPKAPCCTTHRKTRSCSAWATDQPPMTRRAAAAASLCTWLKPAASPADMRSR